jgi:hypothetical protein
MTYLQPTLCDILRRNKWPGSFRDMTCMIQKHIDRWLRRLHLRNQISAPPIEQQPLTYFYHIDLQVTECFQYMVLMHQRRDQERFHRAARELNRAQRRLLDVIEKIFQELPSSISIGRRYSNQNVPLLSSLLLSSPHHTITSVNYRILRADRSYRAKFSQEIREELATFSEAILLSAMVIAKGGKIRHQTEQTEQLRPFACALFEAFSWLRKILRQQCKVDPTSYPIHVKRALELFDETWCQFEYLYITSMVSISSSAVMMSEDQKLQTTLLFSEVIETTLDRQLLKQEDINQCDPSLMMALPRLALLYSLQAEKDEDYTIYFHYGFLGIFKEQIETLADLREQILKLHTKKLEFLERMLITSVSKEEENDQTSWQLDFQDEEEQRRTLHFLFKSLASIADTIQSGAYIKQIRDIMKIIFEYYQDQEAFGQHKMTMMMMIMAMQQQSDPTTDSMKRSAAREARQMQDEERHARERRLNMGHMFIKYGRSGIPTQRYVWITDNMKELVWSPSSDKQRLIYGKEHMFVDQIIEIRRGCQSLGFERHQAPATREQAKRCFSIVFPNRTVDLEAESQEFRDIWCNDMEQLCSHVKQTLSSIHRETIDSLVTTPRVNFD